MPPALTPLTSKIPLDPSPGEPNALRYRDLVNLVVYEARRRGLLTPSYMCPPKSPHLDRSHRRTARGTLIVAVRVRDRARDEIVSDLIEGVVLANLPEAIPCRVESDGVESDGVESEADRAERSGVEWGRADGIRRLLDPLRWQDQLPDGRHPEAA